MAENIKKSKGFVETPSQAVWIMHQWLAIKSKDKVADFTAGRGALFANLPPENCFGVELDVGNHAIAQNKGFLNIILGDFFELIDSFEDGQFDALIMNPPFGRLGKGKNSMSLLNLAINKLKTGGRFAVICAKNDYARFKEARELFSKITIHGGYAFGDLLFKPFATVGSLLIFGEKKPPAPTHEVCLINIPNERIRVNTKSKDPEPKLNAKNAEEIQLLQSEFLEKFNRAFAPPPEPPTLEDFKKTIIDYMAWEYQIPKEVLWNPKDFFEKINRMVREKGEELAKNNKEQ